MGSPTSPSRRTGATSSPRTTPARCRRWDADADAAPEVFDGCPNTEWSVAFAPGGRLFAGCRDGKVRLWDFRAGKEVYEFEGHAGSVSAVALSTDGKIVLSGGEDGTARLWRASGGKALKVLEGQTPVRSVALSADGGVALTGGVDKMVRLWDTAAGKARRIFPGYQGEMQEGLCLSADGKRAAWGGDDGLVHVWGPRPRRGTASPVVQ